MMKDKDMEKRLSLRIAKAKNIMKEKDIEMMLVSKEENKNYLSMFYSTSFYIVLTQSESYLLTDFRYIEAARELEPLYTVVKLETGYNIFDFLREKASGVKSFGVETKSVSTAEFVKLADAVGAGSAEIAGVSYGSGAAGKETVLVTADGIIEKCRIVKEDYEIERIKEAASIADAAFEYILGEIRPGVTEKEIAWLLEKKMRESGASGLSFDTICAAGVHSSMPHAHPTDTPIENGDFVTMDFGCVYDGYCSDMTRTVAVGSITDEQRKIYNIVLKAQKETCDMIRPGITGRDADAFARNIITEAGYGEYFGHGLGHGVGLEIHEAPTANSSGNEIFEKNMLITIEPGIYLPKKFGVRIEDLSVVSESAIMNLVLSQKELIIL